MKTKIFITLIMSFSCAEISYAQTFSGFGFKAGLESAYFTESQYPPGFEYTSNMRLGYTAGIFGEFFKIKVFSILTELDIDQMGGNDKVGETDHYTSINLLSFSILPKFTFSSKKIHPYITAGPRIDILLSKGKDTYSSYLYQNINPENFGISISAGTQIELSPEISLLTEATYSPDLTTYKILSNTGEGPVILRNYAFELRTGLKFNL